MTPPCGQFSSLDYPYYSDPVCDGLFSGLTSVYDVNSDFPASDVDNLSFCVPGELLSDFSNTRNGHSDFPLESITSPLGQKITVFDECVMGSCKCVYDIGGITSQLKPCRFASIIFNSEYSLEGKYADLLWYLTDGCPIVDSEIDPYECENYLSITEPCNKEKMDRILARELAEGMVSCVEDKPHCIHALGAVPKGTGGIRQITDCSRPLGRSVNAHCDSLLNEFSFKSVDDVVGFMNRSDFMTVIDIKAAYRSFPILEAHRKYQGFSWEYMGVKRWFVDNRMCFGLKLGPMYFNYVSTFIFEVLTLKGLKIVNYLDDFIAVSDSLEMNLKARDEVVGLLRFLGFHVAFDKLIYPSTCVTYLGIEIDSEKMELRLPADKLIKLKDILAVTLGSKMISKKSLESLGGLLSHCSHVVKGGRIFCKGIYSLYKNMVNSNKKFARIPIDVKAYLEWWLNLSKYFNGSSKIVKEISIDPIVSDSSLKGFGVYMGTDWCAGTWDDDDYILLSSNCSHVVSRPLCESFDNNNINVLEFWPILVGVKRWAHLLRDKKTVVFTDNTQVMYMLLNGRSSNATCMQWIRELFWICAIYNIDLEPKYINTKDNVVADTLSRIPYCNVSSKLEMLLCGVSLCCLRACPH